MKELEDLKGQAEDQAFKLQELLTEADQQLREVEEKIGPLEEENTALKQRFNQNEVLVASVKKDCQTILHYKNDLEVLIEEQTQHLENKNKRLLVLEDSERTRDSEIQNLEGQLRRITQQADESKKKLL